MKERKKKARHSLTNLIFEKLAGWQTPGRLFMRVAQQPLIGGVFFRAALARGKTADIVFQTRLRAIQLSLQRQRRRLFTTRLLVKRKSKHAFLSKAPSFWLS